jgi:uncharacterized protein with FMN-binding domain
MKKAGAVLVTTAVGLGLVLGFHPHSSSLAGLPPGLSVGGKSGVVSGAVTAVGTDQPLSGGLGDLQVRVSANKGKIVAVGLAQLNLHGPQSAQISGSVLPQLISQTIAAQGGPIQGVSGATYTSQAYVTSLQAALDKIAASGGSNAALATKGNGNGGLLANRGGDGGGNDN